MVVNTGESDAAAMVETIIIAPRGNPASADVRLDGVTDMAVLARLVKTPGAHIKILAGVVNLNGGSSGDPSGGGYLRPARGVTLEGEPGTVLEARSSIVRLTIDQPGVTLRQFVVKGRGHIQWFNTGGDSPIEDVTVDQSDASGQYHNLARNCTAAFLFYARPGTILKNVTLRRCTAIKSYHHGFSMHVYGAQEGATFENFLFEGCRAISCGSGLLSPRDWSTGFNTADTGDVVRVRLVDCYVEDALQSGYHCDGSWTGHAQRVSGLVYERCTAVRCGHRCSPTMYDKYRCGFYGFSGEYIDCATVECVIGFGHGSQEQGGLKVVRCSDDGSTYGMIAALAEPGSRIQFTSSRAKHRAFVGQVTGTGTLDLTVIDPPTPAITFGRTLRISLLDCPHHDAKQANKYDKLGYPVNRSAITVRGVRMPAVEEWPASRFSGVYQFERIENDEQPPAIPNPIPQGNLWCEDGWIWIQPPEGRPRQLVRLPDELQIGTVLSTQDGWVYAAAPGVPARQMFHLDINEQPHFTG